MNRFVTVIICTYNRCLMLERALFALSRQSVSTRRFEVIVVDDGSQDRTSEVCNIFRKKIPYFAYISNGKNMGLSVARNVGIERANGEHVLFTDDDCIPSTTWVERMNHQLTLHPIVVGRIESIVSTYLKLCGNIAEFHAYMLGQKEGPVEFLCGGNMGFRLSLLLEELKGFQYGSRSDDLEIILRARLKGYRAFFAPDAVVTHDPDRSSLAAIMRHSAKQGASSVLLRRHYRGLLHTPTALMSPACVLLSAPLIALKATAEIFLHNSHLRHFLHTAPVVYLAKVAWCWGASQGLRKSQIATP